LFVIYGKGQNADVTIPNVVDGVLIKELGQNLFFYDTAIEHVTFSNGLEIIGDRLFDGCSNLKSVSNFPTTLRKIGANAFTGLTDMELELSFNMLLTEVGEKAFYNCKKLTGDVSNLMRSTITYGPNVFYGCESLRGDIGIALDFYLTAESTEIPDDLFAGFKSLTGTITIPSNIVRVGDRAFKNCSSVEGIDISSATSLQEIGEEAFAETLSLGKTETARKLNFGTSLQVIGRRAFYNSGSGTGALLTNLILPQNLISVGYEAFANSGVYDVCFDCALKYENNNIFIGEYKELWSGNTDPYRCFTFGNCKKLNNASFGTNQKMTGLPNAVFYQSSIVSITFPKANYSDEDTNDFITTSDCAFWGCSSLTTVDLGNLKTIDTYSFYYCTSLSTITWSPCLIGIGGNAFSNCVNLTALPVNSEGKIINTITSLGGASFYNCSILGKISTGDFKTDIVKLLKNSYITTIGNEAFKGCNYLKGAISDGESTIANAASTMITLGKNVFINSSGITYVVFAVVFDPYQKNADGTYIYENGNKKAVTSIGTEYKAKDTFMDIDGNIITDLTIPEGVQTISNNAFKGCKSITSISLPSTLTSIGVNAFDGCSNLVTITRKNDSVTRYNDGVFRYCSKLSTVDFTGITYVGWQCFLGSGITNVTFPEKIKIWGGGFQGCSKLASITINKGMELASGTVHFSNAIITSIDLSTTTFTSASNCFSSCTRLSSVTLPSNMTALPSQLFNKCSALSSITLPNTLQSIGYGCFYQTGLASITIPNSVKQIGYGCFESCTSLTSCTYSTNENLTYIPDSCFRGCTKLSSFTVPSNVTTIQNLAFDNCQALTKVSGCGNVTTLGTDKDGNEGSGVFYYCINLTEVEGMSNVKVLCSNCFYYCSKLTTLGLNWSALTNIKSQAFLNCSSLTNSSYIINGNTCTLGDNALTGSGLASHVI